MNLDGAIIIGLDIGGANVKAVKVVVDSKATYVEDVVREYMPIWIKGIEKLKLKLLEIKQRFGVENHKYFVGACMTAELSDIFSSKDEGVLKIVDVVENVFSDAIKRFYVDIDMNLVEAKDVYRKPLTIAAANWAASAWLLEHIAQRTNMKNIVFVDIGSTTTTIIPVVNGKTMVRGKTDPEKLIYGELVYVGTLRTDVASLIGKAPFKGFYTRICRERFALVADALLVLGHIRSEDYTVDTADGRGKSFEEALARLARSVCADKSIVNALEVREIARYVYEVQIFKVFEALLQVRSWLASLNVDPDDFVVVVAGIGKHIVAEAAKRAGFTKLIIDVDEILGKPLSPVIPAYAVALMVANNMVRKYVDGS